MPRLKVYLFGSLNVTLDGQTITDFEYDKVRALLVYLIMQEDRPYRRQAIAGLLWPDYPERSARASLRNALATLRHALKEDISPLPFLLVEDETIRLNPKGDVWVDVHRFECLVGKEGGDRITDLEEAVALYRGGFLEGFSLKDSPEFDGWAQMVCERLQRKALNAMELLAGLYKAQGKLEEACQFLRRALTLDPWLEEAHQQLMRLLALRGKRIQALMQFDHLQKALRDELGVQPSLETLHLYEQIRDGKFTAQTQPERIGLLPVIHEKPLHNLPVQLTSFIGRKAEIAQIKELIAHHHVVTLTGSGGCGKSRLALETAREVIDLYPDGVWLVELAPLSDPGRVPSAVGRAIGLVESAQLPLQEQLLNYLQDSRMLLVLDNCEHLIESCAQLCGAILNICPDVTLLATSREALEIAGEKALRVPSLHTPEWDQALELDEVWQYAAVQLFEARAEAALPGFQLTSDNLPAVVQVCARLDGVPLAIELAAARVNLLRVHEIALRLDDRIGMLTSSNHSALPRHKTLRACIDWSYELLSEYERHLLLRLSVFSGGWTKEAAEVVCGENCSQPEEVMDALDQLIKKSLVQAERKQGQETRYSLLETIRQYGHEKLVEKGEAAHLGQRHLAYYVSLAEQAKPELRGPRQGDWLRRLEAELGNLRLALNWSLAEHDDPNWWPEEGICLACDLFWFWHARNLWAEAADWLEHLVLAEQRQREEQPLCVEDNPKRVLARARALQNLGLHWTFIGFQGRSGLLNDEAVSEESRRLCQQLGPAGRHGLACALYNLGHIKRVKFNLKQSEMLIHESVDLFREVGDKFNTAECLNELGYSAHHKHANELAKGYFEQSLALRREIGDRDGEANMLCQLGFVIYDLEGYHKASALIMDGFRIMKELDIGMGITLALCILGWISWDEGLHQQALDLFEQAVLLPRRRGGINWYGDPQLFKGRTALSKGDYDQALIWIRDSLEIGRKLKNPGWIAQALEELGQHSWATRQYPQAVQWYREALSVSREYDFKLYAASALCGLGKTALMLEDLMEARYYLAEAFRYFSDEPSDTERVTLNLQYVIATSFEAQQMTQAARLLAATEAPFNRYKNRYLPADRQLRAESLAAIKLALGEEAFANAWKEGQPMPVEQMLALALEVIDQARV